MKTINPNTCKKFCYQLALSIVVHPAAVYPRNIKKIIKIRYIIIITSKPPRLCNWKLFRKYGTKIFEVKIKLHLKIWIDRYPRTCFKRLKYFHNFVYHFQNTLNIY